MERYVCIHGHFYQPPRENPWLEAIELQSSAYPYHDWNARITDECYEPNSASRILNGENRITEIVNNYSKISFNFGPTLLAWLQDNASGVYEAILQADQESQKLFSGHGSAIAQVYNHLIMPLANRRDKYTQVFWGIRDFERRFGRQPEGMWLAETAVDLETLDILAEQGIKYTILAPHQAEFIRQIGASEWQDVKGGHIDPTRVYEITLPSNRKMNLFFYDGPISRAVAFEGLLDNGENFANRLMNAFSDQRQWPQLVHIATDGESYGHHHHFGDMALSYALRHIQENNLASLTNYGEYLAKYPPTYEVQIVEKTSWSCIHGVDRWWRNCGCNTGGHPGWKQEWRTPLRQAMDWLRDTVTPLYEEKARELLKDPWEARNDYISVILDRRPESVRAFCDSHCTHKLKDEEKVRVLKLLELQRHAMLMFTSCGWFFDELSGIETVQVIQYAGRAVQLSEELFGDTTENEFLKRLESAKSNLKEHGNGRKIYDKFVKPAKIDPIKVAAHYTISSLFEEYVNPARIYCYTIDSQDYQKSACGKARVAVGKAKVTSEITWESRIISWGVLHLGDHNVNAGVREYRGEKAYNEMVVEITHTCSVAEFPGVIRLMDKHFGVSNYSLKSLFRDEQSKVLDRILESTLKEVEAEYRKIYQSHYPLMRFLSDLGSDIPAAFKSAAELILNNDLRKALSADSPDENSINKLLSDVNLWNISLGPDQGHAFRQTLEKKMTEFAGQPENDHILAQIVALVGLAASMPFEVELRGVQNIYYRMFKKVFPEIEAKAKQGDQSGGNWVSRFVKLGEALSMRIA
jgi:alpha-amylase/alpha-mannosidase (GH57 family)